MALPQKWLFTPGDGAVPPALTGREDEQATLSRCLGQLRAGVSPPHNVVLVGPRGNGKTVLLRWFEDACREVPVAVARLAPSRIRTAKALAESLLPAAGLRRLLPAKFGVSGVAKAEWATASRSERALADRLAARCARRPLALLLDEAHTLNVDVGQLLLNVVQEVRGMAPLLLVLAGTPRLPAHLNEMDASFWDRLGEGLLGIGRLSAAAARQALEQPMAAHGTTIEKDALDAVVAHSQRYAYFLQLWGDALWRRRWSTSADRLRMSDVQAARETVTAQVADYYQRRYRELEASGLLEAALAAARLYQGDAERGATDQNMAAALADAGIRERDRLPAREALHGLGYIWCPPGQSPPVLWHAGIPSLMQHVLEQAAP